MISLRHEWHALSIEDVLHALQATKHGLTPAEVLHRRARFGRNMIARQKRTNALRVFSRQFASPLVLLLVAAGAVAAFLGDAPDATIISITLSVNVIFGFFEEWKSERALERLQEVVKEEALVRRAGSEAFLAAAELVPGDIVRVQGGDKAPADLRIVESDELTANEAALTGESMPVKKHARPVPVGVPIAEQKSILFHGTVIENGTALAVVVRTGGATEFGKIAASLREVREAPTPLQKALGRLVRTMSAIVGFALLIPFGGGLLRGLPLGDVLLTSIAIAVAAVPAGLVVSVTAVLTKGMSDLLREKALVRRLVSAETLGAISVFATDKTGTLTEGVMRLVDVHNPPHGRTRDEVMKLIAASTVSASVKDLTAPPEKWEALGETTERALLVGAAAHGGATGYRERELIDTVPFSSVRQFHAAAVRRGSGSEHIFVGVPEKILARSELDDASRRHLDDELAVLLKKGSRVVGVGVRTLEVARGFSESEEHELPLLEFVAFAELADPVRADVKLIVEHIQAAGVRMEMITGDNLVTGQSVAASVGIEKVHARITPQEKLAIIGRLQEAGEVVAMTGDGVNDAPALKKADIGVVMGSGQDVAKEVADVVLLDDRLATVVKAIAGGRRIFENIRKVVIFLMYDSFAELLLISAAVIFGLPLPLLPAQILWVNLIEDSFPAFAMAFEPAHPGIMREPPRRARENILGKRELAFTISAGVLTSGFLLALYGWLLAQNLDLAYVRTMVFVGLGIDSLFTVFALRRLHQPIFRTPLFGNLPIVGAVLFGAALYVVGIYLPAGHTLLRTVPLAARDWGFLIGFGLLNLVVIEALKFAFLRKKLDGGTVVVKR